MSDPKIYDPREERWNVITHAAGVFFAPFALAALLYYAKGAAAWTGCIIYVLSMTFMFLGSSMYHAAKDPERRAILRKFDHASIHFLISGTYTPLVILCVPGTEGIVILTISWLITVIGVPLELLGIKPFKGFSIMIYLISGWLCIFIIKTLFHALSGSGLLLLASGGVVYSTGVIFYVSRRLYSHAVWHLFVIAGVALQYFAILSLLFR